MVFPLLRTIVTASVGLGVAFAPVIYTAEVDVVEIDAYVFLTVTLYAAISAVALLEPLLVSV